MKPVLFRITNNLKVGGVQKRLRALLPLLTDDFEVHIVTYRDKGVFFDELADLGVHTHFLPRSGSFDPIAIARLAMLLRRHNADIVHTHSFGGNIFGTLAAALAGVRVRVGQVHLCDLHWYGKSGLRRRKQILEETLIHRALTHKVLFVSEQSRDHFQHHTRLPDSMLEILHNGMVFPDRSMLTPVSKADLKIKAHEKVIGFVGRIAKGKGLDHFIDFASRIPAGVRDRYRFVVIGSGGNLDKWKTLASEKGLGERLLFLGEKTDIFNYYPLLDCLLFTSDPTAEGMPGVVLEACSFGLPILARRSPTLDEVSGYYTRLTFINESGSPLDDLERALAMPEADQTAFRNEFSLENMRERTVELYFRLLDEQRYCL
jgi:glycosyltransferase involved in cell wall biosynthesis